MNSKIKDILAAEVQLGVKIKEEKNKLLELICPRKQKPVLCFTIPYSQLDHGCLSAETYSPEKQRELIESALYSKNTMSDVIDCLGKALNEKRISLGKNKYILHTNTINAIQSWLEGYEKGSHSK